jgi:hypothetical protein
MAIPRPKRKRFTVETKAFDGSSGTSYVVYRTPQGNFHVFMEVEADAAAEDCGAPKKGGTRAKWRAIWDTH